MVDMNSQEARDVYLARRYPEKLRRRESCQHKNRIVENYEEVWRDGDVVCDDCGLYLRGYDAG